MEKVSIRDIQERVYMILKDIDDFCKQEHIKYMLSGGTCLGAVRECGFIPWDDDADIMLNRREYENFLVKFSLRYEKKYKVSSLYTDNNWERPYAKIWDLSTTVIQKKSKEADTGIGVDVFPIDNIPNSKVCRKLWLSQLRILNLLRNASRRSGFYKDEKFICLKKIMGCIISKKSPRYYSEILNNVATLYRNVECEEVGAILALNYWEREFIKKEYLTYVVEKEFVDRKFPVPIGYDVYLTNLYGNYMIPSEKHMDHMDVQYVEINSNVSNNKKGDIL